MNLENTTVTGLKKVFIKTYGCQMNVYDSEKMIEILSLLGYVLTDTPEGAHLFILNTCHIREKASEKVFSDLGRLKVFKDQMLKAGEVSYIAVAGCVAQAEGKMIMERASYVDLVFGPQTYHELPEMLLKLEQKQDGKRRIVNTEFPVVSKFDHLPEANAKGAVSSFVSVQEGCDKFCHFCCVPYTRGAEYSRPVLQIIDECLKLRDQGVKEIYLLGQNVNAYHGQDSSGSAWSLAQLIDKIAAIEGVERIRYTTSHPRDMSSDLIDAHGSIDKLMPYLHLPIQSGSNRILKLMNRKHDRDFYLSIIERLRAKRPDLSLSSDFIVGYPGETDQDFADTLSLVREVTYAQAYSFKYSPRPGTPAAVMENQLDEEVKSGRLYMLQQLLEAQKNAFNMQMKDKVIKVLVENTGRKEGQLFAKSPYLQSVHLLGDKRLIGQIVDVRIRDVFSNSLDAEIVTSEYGPSLEKVVNG